MLLRISVSGRVQILPALHLGDPASKVSTLCQICCLGWRSQKVHI